MIGKINEPVKLVAVNAGNWKQRSGPTVYLRVSLDNKSCSFTPSKDGVYVIYCNSERFEVQVGNVQPTPDPTPEPIPEPSPAGLIYDSNTDINWGLLTSVLKVTDKYGNIAGGGKGFHMNASGSPRMYLDPATKELKLEHDGKYGRAYFCVKNYNSRLECEFMLDDMAHNFSIKTRNRHQVNEEGGQNVTDEHRQGGIGSSYHESEVGQQVEVVHGTNTLDGSKSLSPKLQANKWYKITYTVQDVNGKVRQINTLDGQVVFQRDISPPSQFFNKADFDTWSEFWLRLNATDGGWVKIRNLKLYAL